MSEIDMELPSEPIEIHPCDLLSSNINEHRSTHAIDMLSSVSMLSGDRHA